MYNRYIIICFIQFQWKMYDYEEERTGEKRKNTILISVNIHI